MNQNLKIALIAIAAIALAKNVPVVKDYLGKWL